MTHVLTQTRRLDVAEHAVFHEDAFNGLAGEELHHQAEAPIMLLHVEDPHHVRMRDLGQQPSLSEQPFLQAFVAEAPMQDL